MKRAIICTQLFCLLIVMLLCSGCGETLLTPEEASAAMETLELQYSEVQAERLAELKLVRSDLADKDELAAFSKLRKALETVCGREFDPGTDWVKKKETIPNDLPEILIGDTNRSLSVQLTDEVVSYRPNNQRDFGIRIKDGQIAIAAGNADALSSAVDWFVVNLLVKDTPLPEEYEYIYRHPYQTLELAGEHIADYKLRVAKSVHTEATAVLKELQEDVLDQTGFALERAEADSPAGNYEIIVGETLEDAAAYRIYEDNKNFCVAAGSYPAMLEAVKVLKDGILSGEFKESCDVSGTVEYHIPLELEGGYKLVWHDEFDGDTLNTNIWRGDDTTVEGHDGGTVYRYFTEDYVRVEDGNMIISGYKLDTPNDYETAPHIKTQYSMTYMYGHIEMYAKIPTGKGIWPAFWLNASGLGYDIGPEIDIFEVPGTHVRVESAVHKWPSAAFTEATGREHESLRVQNGDPNTYTLPSGKLSDDYHLYTMDWDEEYILMYFDGILYRRQKMDDELRKELYVIISMLVGASNYPPPDDTVTFPVEYYIDWIRLYQKDGQPITFRNQFE